MEVCKVDSTVCRHHVFREIWMPLTGDPQCKQDGSNTSDVNAVEIVIVDLACNALVSCNSDCRQFAPFQILYQLIYL